MMKLIDADDVLSIVDDLRDQMTVEGYCAMTERIKALPDLQPTCNQLATDVISRQAAIDAVFGRSHDIIKQRLKNLPSA